MDGHLDCGTELTQLQIEQARAAAAVMLGCKGFPARTGDDHAATACATSSIEDIEAANPQGRNWFQLYMWKDRDRSQTLIERAAVAGFDTLVVTVDVPVAGALLRDGRNGMTIPPSLTAGVVDALRHPAW